VTPRITEVSLESIVCGYFADLGYTYLYGPAVAPGEPKAERNSFNDVILERRLRDVIARLNPDVPAEAQEDAIRKVLRPETPVLLENNLRFHRMVVNGVTVEYKRPDGTVRGDQVRLLDFDNPANNDFLVVNQFAVSEGQNMRIPDLVVFVNGLPLAVVELKNPADEKATIYGAYNQLQTYKAQIGSLFTYNEILAVSDGLNARFGSLTASYEWFLPWHTIEGEREAKASELELEVLVKGLFDPERLLNYVRHFIVIEKDTAGNYTKKIARYHQFHAVNHAVETTVAASRPSGDKRGGVVWHTQGSGKSLTMAFFAGRIILHPEMANPTIVVITDRNDLDEQLFGTFANCHELLRQKPVQAESRAHLRELLQVAAGGVIFTTIQKFFPDEEEQSYPQLSDRHNIVVIADEAHRSQYGFIDGSARHMRDALPNASFIGFTGTPIELKDRNTRAVFGDYISVYDIQRAVADGATVPIYYESRLANLELDEKEKPYLDEDFDEVTEGQEEATREYLKTKWAALEKLVGTEKRLKLIAEDLINHFEEREKAMGGGKAMVVCMSRRICVDLYGQIIKLRPNWHGDSDDRGAVKIVMTGAASDKPEWQQHVRNKTRREALANRFKDPDENFKIVIVRDMWLTGFDVPCLHTMYVDKPMRGHNLMQAIARVNRVFHDKPGGLVVDYIGLAHQLKLATHEYTESGGAGETAIDKEKAIEVMLKKYEVCLSLFHGFDWSGWSTRDIESQLKILPGAQEHILSQDDGKKRLFEAVNEVSKAFALAVPDEKALAIRDDLSFFQAVRSALIKSDPSEQRTLEELDFAIGQILSKAVSSDEVVDIFAAAGLDKPDISLLSDEFLKEVRDLPHRNLAVELLNKLLNDEIKTRFRRNLVQARSFTELLEKTILAYQNRTIEAAKVIEELIGMAKDIREAKNRGEELGLTDDEIAFYDALETNDSAVQVLGDETLKKIAQELVETVRNNVTIDWAVRESVRAKLRVMVKRILRKYGYPPDKQEKATKTVLQQAEVICGDW
jgi:type I restriction enzyme R subunit